MKAHNKELAVTSDGVDETLASTKTDKSDGKKVESLRRWLALCAFAGCFVGSFVCVMGKRNTSKQVFVEDSGGRELDVRGSRRRLQTPVHHSVRTRKRMEKKLAEIPPPEWPELDHGTVEAIANGIIFGPPSPERPDIERKATIVTAYYDFPSKHSTEDYMESIARLLVVMDPMVIFLEPGSMWVDWFMERRQHAPTIIAQRPFDELVMSTTFTEGFWREQLEMDEQKDLHNGTGVLKIWNEKPVLLNAVAQLNPFCSYSFAWMDAGYFHKHPPDNENIQVLIRTNITEAGVADESMLMLHVCDLKPEKPWEVCNAGPGFMTAGNAFIGTKNAVHNFFEKYYETFWAMKEHGLFVGDDQHIMTKTCCSNQEYCHMYYMGLLQRWFILGQELFKPMNYFFRSERFANSCKGFEIDPVLPLPSGVVSNV